MGHEIRYCHRCKIALTKRAFDEGRAVTLGLLPACSDCAPNTPAPRVLVEVTPRPLPAVASPSTWKPIAMVAACCLGVGGLVTLVHVVWGNNPTPAPRVVAPPPSPVVHERPAKPPSALERARLYRESQPDDYAGQSKLYWDAVWQTEGTPSFETARAELQQVLRDQKRAMGLKLTDLEWLVSKHRKQEQFYRAKKALTDARDQMNDPDWEASIEKMSTDLDEEIDELYASVRAQAVEAQRQGQAAAARLILDRVNAWGLAEKSLDLMNALTNPK